MDAATLQRELAHERREVRRAAVATALTVIGLIVGIAGAQLDRPGAATAGYLMAYGFGALPAAYDALRALRRGVIAIDLLMVLAALAAAAVGESRDGAILLALFSLAQTLEAAAMGRTRRSVAALMGLRPDSATVLEDGGERTVPVAEVAVGARVLVRPGERVPLDGVVETGVTTVDRSPITGESVPVDAFPGESVFAGSLNGAGAVTVRVRAPASASTLARMVQLVTEARATRAPSERFSEWFGRRYTIAVLIGTTLALAAFLAFGLDHQTAFYRAATLLVVASPCAVVISVPAAVLSALSAAARRGVLFKGGGALEAFGEVDAVAFDKTGTLTSGVVRVHEVVGSRALSVAASLEARSEHPLAKAVLREAESIGMRAAPATEVRSLPGRGVAGVVDGRPAWAGNQRLARDRGADLRPFERDLERLGALGWTLVVVGVEREVLGVMAVGDELRPHASQALTALRQAGVREMAILSGDRGAVARAAARSLGLEPDAAAGDLLPEDKVARVRELRRRGTVAFVGDGVNDAAAMAAADVGVAMGAAGSDVALETADVALLDDDLRRLSEALTLARRARATIRQNLGFALGIMLVMVVATFAGVLPLPLGVLGHEGGTLLVVANGLRLMRVRPPGPPSATPPRPVSSPSAVGGTGR